jgi:hypothetical protein
MVAKWLTTESQQMMKQKEDYRMEEQISETAGLRLWRRG